MDHDAGQVHDIRPGRAEADAAVEMKAVGIETKQQLPAQDDAAARQEDPEKISAADFGIVRSKVVTPTSPPSESGEAVTSNTGCCRLRRIPPSDPTRERRGVWALSVSFGGLPAICFTAPKPVIAIANGALNGSSESCSTDPRLTGAAIVPAERTRGDERRGKRVGAEDLQRQRDRIAVGVCGDA